MELSDNLFRVSDKIWNYHINFPYTGEAVHTTAVMALKNVLDPVYVIADTLHDSTQITLSRDSLWMELYRLPALPGTRQI